MMQSVVNHLLCPIYDLNLIMDVCISENNTVSMGLVMEASLINTSSRGIGTYPLSNKASLLY